VCVCVCDVAVYIAANFALLVTFNVAILLSDRVDISREQGWIADPLYLDLILMAANSLGPLIVLKWELFRQAQERVDKGQRQELLQAQAEQLAGEKMSEEFFKFANPVSATLRPLVCLGQHRSTSSSQELNLSALCACACAHS
jgi:hypothetical protein